MSNRESSYWIRLRNFHNAIKFKLLQSVVNYYDENGIKKLSLLDVSVGKGGDYPKWKKLGIQTVVGMDPSRESIEGSDGAKDRLKKDKSGYKNRVDYIYTDPDTTAITANWSKMQPPLKQKLYDIVSCQMSLHYFFKNKDMLFNAIKNISDSLLPGGIFIGTSMNDKKIVKNLIKSKSKFPKDLILFEFIKEKQELTPSYVLKWGDNGEIKNYMKKEKEQDPKLDLDREFLVDRNLFVKVCKHYNLYPVQIDDFVKDVVSFEEWHERLVEGDETIELWRENKDMEMKDYEKFMSFMYESFVFIKRINLLETSN